MFTFLTFQEQAQTTLNNFLDWCITKGIAIVLALLFIFISFKIVNFITKRIRKRMIKKNADKTATNVVYYLLNKGLKILIFAIAISTLGVDGASIAAVFAAAGLGIGLAVQGALSNFAGGVLVLIMRPFKLDDYIAAQGLEGTVEDIHLFYTYLRTPDNKVIMIPNGSLTNGNIVNYSTKKERRVDLTFNIDYTENYKDVEKIILDICNAHEHVLKDPAPFVRLGECAANSLDIICRAWVKNEDFWDVRFDLIDQIYAELKAKGIKIPYNQFEISYRNNNEGTAK